MSGHQAIAAVTSALQKILQAAIALDDVVADGRVTSRAPDRARTGNPINQVNLFLYRTAIDPAWRNTDPPGSKPGETGQPPLPLVLSYVLTAYGEDDDEILAHRLLGVAMSTLNDTPLLSRQVLAEALPGSGLDLQSERVRIIPGPIPQDEISRMWATFSTGYRISVTYDVAVVLIDSSRPVTRPLPVLTRGSDDRGPNVLGVLAPTLDAISPSPLRPDPDSLAADLVLTGRHLGAVGTLEVRGASLTDPVTIVPSSVTDQEIRATVTPNALPAGTFGLVASNTPVPGMPSLSSAEIPFALAPVLTTASPVKAKLTAAGTATLKLTCAPATVAGQSVSLIIGNATVAGNPVDTHPEQVVFTLRDLAKGTYPIRLRIDRQDSLQPTAAGAGGASFQLLELT